MTWSINPKFACRIAIFLGLIDKMLCIHDYQKTSCKSDIYIQYVISTFDYV